MHKGKCLDTELVGREELCLQHQFYGQTLPQNKGNRAEVQIGSSKSFSLLSMARSLLLEIMSLVFRSTWGYLST